jgi:hypothetical protein
METAWQQRHQRRQRAGEIGAAFIGRRRKCGIENGGKISSAAGKLAKTIINENGISSKMAAMKKWRMVIDNHASAAKASALAKGVIGVK